MTEVRKSRSWSETLTSWLPKMPFTQRHKKDEEVIFKPNLSTVSAPAKIPAASDHRFAPSHRRLLANKTSKGAYMDFDRTSDSESDEILHSTLKQEHNYAKKVNLQSKGYLKPQRQIVKPPRRKSSRCQNFVQDSPDSESDMEVGPSNIGAGDVLRKTYKPKSKTSSKTYSKRSKPVPKFVVSSVESDDSDISDCEFIDRGHRQAKPQVSGRRLKDPKLFNAQSVEWSDYLKHFEAVAEWNRWSQSEKAKQLVMSFDGEAIKLLGELSDEVLHDYKLLVHELNRRYDPTERAQAWKIEFRNRFRKQHESITQYAQVLNRLALKAFPNMHTSAQQQWVLDQFTLGLGSIELQRHVQFGHPRDLNAAISLAIEYEAFESGTKMRKPFNKASEVFAVSPVATAVNMNDKNVQHGNRNQTPFQEHDKPNECQNDNMPATKFCHYCKSTGHIINDCWKLKRKQQNELHNNQSHGNHSQQNQFSAGYRGQSQWHPPPPNFGNSQNQVHGNNSHQPYVPTYHSARQNSGNRR